MVQISSKLPPDPKGIQHFVVIVVTKIINYCTELNDQVLILLIKCSLLMFLQSSQLPWFFNMCFCVLVLVVLILPSLLLRVAKEKTIFQREEMYIKLNRI